MSIDDDVSRSCSLTAPCSFPNCPRLQWEIVPKSAKKNQSFLIRGPFLFRTPTVTCWRYFRNISGCPLQKPLLLMAFDFASPGQSLCKNQRRCHRDQRPLIAMVIRFYLQPWSCCPTKVPLASELFVLFTFLNLSTFLFLFAWLLVVFWLFYCLLLFVMFSTAPTCM